MRDHPTKIIKSKLYNSIYLDKMGGLLDMEKIQDFIILDKNSKLYWNDDLGWMKDISKATLYIFKPKSLLKEYYRKVI